MTDEAREAIIEAMAAVLAQEPWVEQYDEAGREWWSHALAHAALTAALAVEVDGYRLRVTGEAGWLYAAMGGGYGHTQDPALGRHGTPVFFEKRSTAGTRSEEAS